MGAGDEHVGQAGGYWRGVLRATFVLGAAWLVAAVLMPWWARQATGTVFGFPLGYWLAAQGALLGFLAIVVACVVWMERLEAPHAAEPSSTDPKDVDR
jgi:putative solute:sodium symporter small subunit